jgi:hypothetical protein
MVGGHYLAVAVVTGAYNAFKRKFESILGVSSPAPAKSQALLGSRSIASSSSSIPPPQLPISIIPSTFAGSLTGLGMVVVSTPFEMVKIRMQLDNVTTKMFTSSTQCARHLVANHGVSILYRGTVVNMYREVLFCTVYFTAYELVRNYLYDSGLSGIPVVGNALPPIIAGAFRYAAMILDAIDPGPLADWVVVLCHVFAA